MSDWRDSLKELTPEGLHAHNCNLDRASMGLKIRVGERMELSNGTSIIVKAVLGQVVQVVVCLSREVKLYRMKDSRFKESDR